MNYSVKSLQEGRIVIIVTSKPTKRGENGFLFKAKRPIKL